MTVFQYDSTFEGLLTALFDAYYRRTFPDLLLTEKEPLPLFHEEVHQVVTDAEKTERVWKLLSRKLSRRALASLTYCWLSETPEAAMLLFRYMRKVTDAPASIEQNFADPDVLGVYQLSKKVADERMRVLQFMRFQKTADQVYFGIMEPLYNVYPLTIYHFRDRFADQPWIIYDARRHYGYYYDLKEVCEITFEDSRAAFLRHGKLEDELLDKNEKLFQEGWKSYFHSVCIQSRLNPVKHKKHMPFSICFLLFLYYSLFSHLFVLIGNPIWQGIRAVSTPQKILWHGHFPARGSAQGGPLPLQWQFHGLWCISSRFFPAKEGLSAVQSSMYRQGVLVRYRESFWLAAKRSTSIATTFAPGTR